MSNPFVEYVDTLQSAHMESEFQKFKDAFGAHRRIIVLGNGGSSSVASHISQDYMTHTHTRTHTHTHAHTHTHTHKHTRTHGRHEAPHAPLDDDDALDDYHYDEYDDRDDDASFINSW